MYGRFISGHTFPDNTFPDNFRFSWGQFGDDLGFGESQLGVELGSVWGGFGVGLVNLGKNCANSQTFWSGKAFVREGGPIYGSYNKMKLR